MIGKRYVIPQRTRVALEHVFQAPVDEIVVIENSLYARAHLGASATTRPNRILLAGSGAQFIAAPELLLHEYFHVVRQWRPGYLTRWRYLKESARRGYWANRYEHEAREFTAAALTPYLRRLGQRTQ
ncbi:MAG TPA: DUF4157 domain-containing protein [Steroidobacteraceae bacterium]|jgi:hypothetical protein|nr:DUF4157 domain-containing protein [Steroidobacteraceae bacterium]